MIKLSITLGKWIHEVEQIPAYELMEYMAMYSIEPFGADRDDIRTAYAAAVTYNINRPRRAKGMKPKEFIPQFRAARAQSPEHIKNVLTMFANAQNAKVKTNG